MNIKENLKKNIKYLRRKNNLTQSQLADIADIKIRQLQIVERCENISSVDTIYKIAKALNTTVDYLIENEDYE